MKNTRILIFIVAYNHENFIESVLERVPRELAKYDTEILIIDDASQDRTFETAMHYPNERKLPFKITVLVNPKNQQYGGNQKLAASALGVSEATVSRRARAAVKKFECEEPHSSQLSDNHDQETVRITQ